MNTHTDFDESRELENQLYALILPVLAKYEARGFNSHQRTQNICAETVEKCRAWIWMNKKANTPSSEGMGNDINKKSISGDIK